MGSGSSRRYFVFGFKIRENGKPGMKVMFPPPDEYCNAETAARNAYNMCLEYVPDGNYMLALFERDNKTKEVSKMILAKRIKPEFPADELVDKYQRTRLRFS